MNLVYVGGWGRSGTTLFSTLLANELDAIFLGEIRYLWDRGLVNKTICGCGDSVPECSYWQEVLSGLGSFESEKEANHFASTVGSKGRKTQFLTFFPFMNKVFKKKNKLEISVLSEVYERCMRHQHNATIVDSSKSPFYFSALKLPAKSNVFFVHLVRDPRGVAYSWKKTKKTGDDAGGQDNFPKYSSLRSGFQWMIVNSLCLLMKRRPNVKYVPIEYEEFSSSPEKVIRKLKDMILPDAVGVERCASHSISGNPVRHKSISFESVRPDNEWINKLKKIDKILVDIITFPYFVFRWCYEKKS